MNIYPDSTLSSIASQFARDTDASTAALDRACVKPPWMVPDGGDTGDTVRRDLLEREEGVGAEEGGGRRNE